MANLFNLVFNFIITKEFNTGRELRTSKELNRATELFNGPGIVFSRRVSVLPTSATMRERSERISFRKRNRHKRERSERLIK